MPYGKTLRYVRYLRRLSGLSASTNIWDDTAARIQPSDKIYVVQTATEGH